MEAVSRQATGSGYSTGLITQCPSLLVLNEVMAHHELMIELFLGWCCVRAPLGCAGCCPPWQCWRSGTAWSSDSFCRPQPPPLVSTRYERRVILFLLLDRWLTGPPSPSHARITIRARHAELLPRALALALSASIRLCV
jgi:hypothetical protein